MTKIHITEKNIDHPLPTFRKTRVVVENIDEARMFFFECFIGGGFKVCAVNPPKCQVVSCFRDAQDFFNGESQ